MAMIDAYTIQAIGANVLSFVNNFESVSKEPIFKNSAPRNAVTNVK